MTENKGDLISREALKTTIIEPLNVNDACKNDWYEGYYTAKNEDIMTIDNAPTVTSFTLEDIEGIRAETIKMMKNRYERPQGEWIMQRHDLDGQFYTCSICGRMIRVSPYVEDNETLKDYPFCHCGADMRGKAMDFEGFGVNGY